MRIKNERKHFWMMQKERKKKERGRTERMQCGVRIKEKTRRRACVKRDEKRN